MNFKRAISGKSDKAVISEVNNGETYIREKYEGALEDDKISPETRSVLEKALGSVRAGQFFASRLDQSLSFASSGSSSRNGWGLKVAGAAGFAGLAYAAYRMFGSGRSSRERSLRPRLAQEYGGGLDAKGHVSMGQNTPQSGTGGYSELEKSRSHDSHERSSY